MLGVTFEQQLLIFLLNQPVRPAGGSKWYPVPADSRRESPKPRASPRNFTFLTKLEVELGRHPQQVEADGRTASVVVALPRRSYPKLVPPARECDAKRNRINETAGSPVREADSIRGEERS